MLVINCKNYAEAMDAGTVRSLVAEARRASARHGVLVAVAPPGPMLAVAAEAALRPAKKAQPPPPARGRRQRAAPAPDPARPLILSQHTDDVGDGSTTGHIAAAAVKAAGADGSLVNHSECRVPAGRRRGAVERLRTAGLVSVVCAATLSEAAAVAGMAPDYVAIEPPSLIGTGRAISKVRPGLITKATEAVKLGAAASGRRAKRSPRAPRLLCGAGISSAEDVRLAADLGSAGVLVASGIVKAADRAAAIDSFRRGHGRSPAADKQRKCGRKKGKRPRRPLTQPAPALRHARPAPRGATPATL